MLVSLTGYASGGCVNFSVTDSVGEPVAYATVRIYQMPDTVKAVVLDVTDADGSFTASLPGKADYSLALSSVGMEPVSRRFAVGDDGSADLGVIVMRRGSAMLDEVEVVAQRPLIKAEIDRLSYDIQADEDSKTKTIFDMLRKVPLVAVDAQENVLVKGSSSFKIYKNGRPNSAWSRNPRDVLKSIPASMIRRIEVITEPGAKYDAEGVNGILNIVTMENTMVKGAAGSVGVYAGQRGDAGGNAYVAAQLGKFTATVNYGMNYNSEKSSRWVSEAEQVYGDSGNRLRSESDDTSSGAIHYGNIEASYEIDSLNLVTLAFGGYSYGVIPDSYGTETMTDAAGSLLYGFNTHTYGDKYRYFDFDGKLDYQRLTRRKGESVIFSYLLSTTSQTQEMDVIYTDGVNMPVPYDRRDTDSRLRFFEHTFQLDYTRPFGSGHRIETGAKYILRLNDSETAYRYSVPEMDEFTDFRHTTQVGALYAEYAYNSSRWGARAGLRYEYSHLSAKYPSGRGEPFSSDMSDLVPTLSASYNINSRNSLKLNFATRVRRPGISYLNPAVNRTPTSVSCGNPDLTSARRHSLSLTYTFMHEKVSVNASVYGGYSDDQINSVVTVVPDGNGNDVVYSTYRNVGKSLDAGAFGYVQWRIDSRSSVMANMSAGWLQVENRGLGLRNSGWNANMYASADRELVWKIKLTASGGWYRSGPQGVYTEGGRRGWYALALTRSFLKENRLSVSVQAVNPIGMKYNDWRTRTVRGDYTGWSCGRREARSYMIRMSYRFGSFRATVKKTAKTIRNDDLEGRK